MLLYMLIIIVWEEAWEKLDRLLFSDYHNLKFRHKFQEKKLTYF